MPHFDLIIVGTGVAGRTAAEDAAAAGLKIALVDRREFGGTCALRGCEPKKVLFAAAEVPMRTRRQAGSGVIGDASVDWRQLIAFKHAFTDPQPAAFEAEFTGLGVEVMHGVARFTSPDALDIGGTPYTAEAFLVATGAMPMPLGIEGEELLVDSDHFMERDELPERIAFIGGGFISFELAGMASAAGSRPIILHRSEQALKEFDPDLVGLLIAEYAEEGIEVRVCSPVAVVCHNAGGFDVQLAEGEKVTADLVVHGAGRVPDLDALELEAGGVARGRHGIEVDTGMHSTTNPRVWAAGDAAGLGPALTPVGVAQARVAVKNIVTPGSAKFAPPVIPSAVFSQPPLASVGLSERDVRERGLDVEVKLTDTSSWISSRRVGLKHTGAKTLVDRATGRILGAHVLGHNAEEVINLFALAIAKNLTAEELKSMLWAYPTASSEIVYWV